MTRNSWIFLFFVFCFYLQLPKSILLGQNQKLTVLPVELKNGMQYDPAISSDGKHLVFVAKIQEQFKLFICDKVDNKWTNIREIKAINQFNKGEGNIRHPSFSFDGNTLYYDADFYKYLSNVDIFFSTKTDSTWSKPKKMNKPINSKFYDGQPSISSDGRSLYFCRKKSIDSKPTDKCFDIFVSRKTTNDTWKTPKLLPLSLGNTCLHSPKIALDNKTLFYSLTQSVKNTHFDIYKTVSLSDNVWMPPQKLNISNENDKLLSLSSSFEDKYAVFSKESTYKKQLTGKIYRIKNAKQLSIGKSINLHGEIVDENKKRIKNISISVFDYMTLKLVAKYSNICNTGVYNILLPEGKDYLLDFGRDNYSHSIFVIKAKKLTKNTSILKNIKLSNKVELMLSAYDDKSFNPINTDIVVKNKKATILQSNIIKVTNGLYLINLPIGDAYQIELNSDSYKQKSIDIDLSGIIQFTKLHKNIGFSSQTKNVYISVVDNYTNAGVPVKLHILDAKNNNAIVETAITGTDGKCNVKLKPHANYILLSNPESYWFCYQSFRVGNNTNDNNIVIKLTPLQKNSIISFSNISFDENSEDLTNQSYTTLNKIVQLMKDNPKTKFQISVSKNNDNDFSERLSIERALAIKSYIVTKSISENRLIIKKYIKTDKNEIETDNTHTVIVEFKVI